MREFWDVLVAAAGIWVGWWACDIRHHAQRERERDRFQPFHISEPPSNVLSIVEDDGDGLIS